MTDKELEEFLARGGKITRIASDVRTMTDRELFLVTRDQIKVVRELTDEEIESRAEQLMETVQQAALVGGRSAAVQALNDFNSGYDKAAAQDRMARLRDEDFDLD